MTRVDCPKDAFFQCTLLFFVAQVFDVVNMEKYSLKFLKLLRVKDGYQLSSLSVVKWSSELKKRSPGGFNLSFLPWISRMIASTVISLVIYITAVLGSHNFKKRSRLLQLRSSLWNFTFVIIDSWSDQVVTQHNQYRAQYGASALTWSQSRYSGALAHAKTCVFEHRYEPLFFHKHKGENLFYQWSGRSIWRKFGRSSALLKTLKVIHTQVVCS